jgi:hypothetical protein
VAAQLADAPVEPTTVTNQATIVVNWSLPYNGATSITSYTITLRESDELTYTEALVPCDGTSTTIIASRTCTIPVSVLRAEPFNTEWGSSIFVKVSANNMIGSGPFSVAGNGAIMLTIPDAPINLSNDEEVTNSM